MDDIGQGSPHSKIPTEGPEKPLIFHRIEVPPPRGFLENRAETFQLARGRKFWSDIHQSPSRRSDETCRIVLGHTELGCHG